MKALLPLALLAALAPLAHADESAQPKLRQTVSPAPDAVRETLRRAWSRLDDGSRDLLAGKYILEKSDDEIAEELGCASGSVRMKLTRARRRLLETMKEEEADHGKT